MEQQPQEEPNPLMRKKKTPEELAAEAEQEDLDDFTSKSVFPFSSLPPPSPIPILTFHFISQSHSRLSLSRKVEVDGWNRNR